MQMSDKVSCDGDIRMSAYGGNSFLTLVQTIPYLGSNSSVKRVVPIIFPKHSSHSFVSYRRLMDKTNRVGLSPPGTLTKGTLLFISGSTIWLDWKCHMASPAHIIQD